METRVLVALENEFRAYREVLAAGVQSMRSDVQVATTVPASLEEEVAHFDPQVIICSGSNAADIGNATTWIELSTDPSRPTVVRLGGRRFERSNPTFEALLDIVDETRRLVEAEEKERDGMGGSPEEGAAPSTD